jgi:hypothetical protein
MGGIQRTQSASFDCDEIRDHPGTAILVAHGTDDRLRCTQVIGAALGQFDMESGNGHQKAKPNGVEFPFSMNSKPVGQ